VNEVGGLCFNWVLSCIASLPLHRRETQKNVGEFQTALPAALFKDESCASLGNLPQQRLAHA